MGNMDIQVGEKGRYKGKPFICVESDKYMCEDCVCFRDCCVFGDKRGCSSFFRDDGKNVYFKEVKG